MQKSNVHFELQCLDWKKELSLPHEMYGQGEKMKAVKVKKTVIEYRCNYCHCLLGESKESAELHEFQCKNDRAWGEKK